jgi:hypothetical protein
MPLVVPLAAGVRLREVLHMEDDDAERFVSLFSVDTKLSSGAIVLVGLS